MQIIRSMLMLQAAEYSNKQIQVQDTGNRIQAMALVHQMLYKSENLSKINVKDYVEELSSLIFQNFQTSSQKVSLVLEIEEFALLIDTAIPLGLVLNELMSNSLKHAFPYFSFRIIGAMFLFIGIVSLLLLLFISQSFVSSGQPNSSHFQTLGQLLRVGRDWINHIAMILPWSIGGLLLYYSFLRMKIIPIWLSL